VKATNVEGNPDIVKLTVNYNNILAKAVASILLSASLSTRFPERIFY